MGNFALVTVQAAWACFTDVPTRRYVVMRDTDPGNNKRTVEVNEGRTHVDSELRPEKCKRLKR